jgi:hypothetical protein
VPTIGHNVQKIESMARSVSGPTRCPGISTLRPFCPVEVLEKEKAVVR